MKRKCLSKLLLVLCAALPIALSAEEPDAITQIAIDAAAAETAKANAKAETARKAAAATKAAEAERVAGLQRKCEKNGGDWKRGKCVMPPPPKPVVVERKPQPQPAPVPVVEPAPIASSAVIAPQMVSIPAGTFTMGCEESRDNVSGGCGGDEKPAHAVTLNAYQMGKTEVTFAEWDACEAAKVCPHADDAGWGRGKRPVINVSWNDAQTYIKWLNAQTGKRYRLPSEAEWEYAARGGRESAYPWGNSISCGNADYNYKDCNAEGTSPVGSYAANGYGLYDTAGNVWEWCQDWYGSDYYASSPASNPQGAGSGTNRVMRGGSWYNDAQDVRSAYRYGNAPVNRYYSLGFRLVLP